MHTFGGAAQRHIDLAVDGGRLAVPVLRVGERLQAGAVALDRERLHARPPAAVVAVVVVFVVVVAPPALAALDTAATAAAAAAILADPSQPLADGQQGGGAVELVARPGVAALVGGVHVVDPQVAVERQRLLSDNVGPCQLPVRGRLRRRRARHRCCRRRRRRQQLLDVCGPPRRVPERVARQLQQQVQHFGHWAVAGRAAAEPPGGRRPLAQRVGQRVAILYAELLFQPAPAPPASASAGAVAGTDGALTRPAAQTLQSGWCARICAS